MARKKTRLLFVVFGFAVIAGLLLNIVTVIRPTTVYAAGESYVIQKNTSPGVGGNVILATGGFWENHLPSKFNKKVTFLQIKDDATGQQYIQTLNQMAEVCNVTPSLGVVHLKINNLVKASGGGYTATLDNGGCTGKIGTDAVFPNGTISISDPSNLGPGGGGGALPGDTTTPGGDNETVNAPTCLQADWSLTWIMCPIVNGLADASDKIMQSVIKPLLKTEPLDVSNSGNDPSNIYNIWSNFRVYGNIFLIIAVLVIVFAEAIGGGLIEAYTARKVLPRILVAAILINLSIYFVAIMIDVTNVLGDGIHRLITTPFRSAVEADGTTAYTIGLNGGASLSLSALLGVLIWKLSLGGAFLSFIALSVILPMFIAFLAIVATLLIRRGLILFLILISPIAFALYVLPNTEKYFRQWWEVLFKTLLVYPIIMIIFSLGNILSVTIYETGKTGGMAATLASLMSVAALLLPLFMIPFAFRIAGGTIGRLYGAFAGGQQKLNDMSQDRKARAKDALKRREIDRMAGMSDKFGQTGLGKNLRARNSGLGRLVNRRMEGIDHRARMAAGDFAKDPYMQSISNDDNALRAMTYRGDWDAARRDIHALTYNGAYSQALKAGESEESAKAIAAQRANYEANRAVASARAVSRGGVAEAVTAAQMMVDTGTSYDSIEDMTKTIARAGGGNASTIANVAGYANSATKRAGRHDLSPGFSNLYELSLREAGLAGGTVQTGGKGVTYDDAHDSAWNSASLYQHANDKTSNIKAHIQHFESILKKGDAATDREKESAAVFFNELRAMQPNAIGEVGKQVSDALERNAVPLQAAIASLPPTESSTQDRPASVQEVYVRDPQGNYTKQTQRTGGIRSENAQERIARKSRSYERFDPNNVTDTSQPEEH